MSPHALASLPSGSAAEGRPPAENKASPYAKHLNNADVGFAGHAHLWVLLDGTPAHAAPGRLVANDDGQLACHLCGRWFRHLGAHLRRHGWTAAQYREAVGLALHVPLCGSALSEQIAARQKIHWDRSLETRNRLAPGRELARSGELSRRALAAAKLRQDSGQIPDAVLRARAGRLAAGRATQAEQMKRRVAAAVTAAGAASLHELLRTRYSSGASIEQLAKLTGLARSRVRGELVAAGATIRASGASFPASKHARSKANDVFVAARVGTGDVHPWLLAQRQAGATLRELAQRTGRSIPWVQSRLADSSAIAGSGT